jgi:hypothetical protein
MGQERETWIMHGETKAGGGPGGWARGPAHRERALVYERASRATQFERALGLVLWLVLVIVLFELS